MIDFDREFHADGWAQRIVDYLSDTEGGTASLDTLVEHVIEHDANAVAPDRPTVTYELVHVCLPALADHGVVEFDERTETITYRPSAER